MLCYNKVGLLPLEDIPVFQRYTAYHHKIVLTKFHKMQSQPENYSQYFYYWYLIETWENVGLILYAN